MKTIIAGSRDFTDYNFLDQKIKHMIPTITEVVSGAARGVDTLGESFAYNHSIPLKRFPADWNKHGKAAGFIRNREMAEYADRLIAFWDGESKGTKHMISVMELLKKPFIVISTA